MYLLDTNVVSELRKASSGRANVHVVEWARSVPVELLFISVISIQELEKGVLLKERVDPHAGAILRSWLNDNVHSAFENRVVPVDKTIAICSAAYHVPDPQPAMGALIAATATVHGLTVVTRDEKDFEHFGVRLLNPWKAPGAPRIR